MQINSLFEIVYQLLDRKNMTAKELAEHFEVSTRTILRDIETLSMAGIPIYTVQGKGGGVRLMDNFVLNKSVLTDKEQQDILSALQGLNAVEVPEVEKVLSKLVALFNKNTTSWIDIDFSPWGSNASEKDKFSILRDAILSKKMIQFDYFSYYGEKSRRICEPLQIVFKDKAWYLSAFCKGKEDYRTFKLSRIKNLAVTADTFDGREIRSISGAISPNKLCTVTLKIDKDMHYRVRDEFKDEDITENDDGTFTVKTLMPNDEWGYGCIMSYGEHAEVLAPDYIRTLIQSKFKEAAKKYL